MKLPQQWRMSVYWRWGLSAEAFWNQGKIFRTQWLAMIASYIGLIQGANWRIGSGLLDPDFCQLDLSEGEFWIKSRGFYHKFKFLIHLPPIFWPVDNWIDLRWVTCFFTWTALSWTVYYFETHWFELSCIFWIVGLCWYARIARPVSAGFSWLWFFNRVITMIMTQISFLSLHLTTVMDFAGIVIRITLVHFYR